MENPQVNLEHMHVRSDSLERNEAAAAPSVPAPVTPVTPVVMKTFQSPQPDPLLAKVTIKPSTYDSYLKLLPEIQNRQVYDTSKAKKGKALIIAVTKFTNMKPLPGYDVDRKLLSRLWEEMGFDVLIPQGGSTDGLTGLEIRMALTHFSTMFGDEDQMAVVCIMSHGNNGVIYGRDGNSVPVDEIITYLDNENCIKMASKPKLCVIQACRGGRFDRGVDVRTGYETAAGVESYKVPSKSDMLTCYSVIRGDVSFVNHNDGSIYIQKFIKAVREGAATEEIHHILIKVNESMSKTGTPHLQTNQTYEEVYCQMPSFESSLTRKLYMLPCPGSKQGIDWRVSTFTTEGELVRTITSPEIKHLVDICYQVCEDRYVVADRDSHCLHFICADTGKVLKSVPADEARDYPGGGRNVFMAASRSPHSSRLVTADHDKNLVKLYDGEGNFIRSYTGTGAETGEFKRLIGVCFDHQDRILVCDMNNHRLVCISPDTEDDTRSYEVIMDTSSLGLGHPIWLDVTLDGLLVMAFYTDSYKGPFNIAVLTEYQ